MSSTLVYRPVGGGKSLPNALKFALRKKYDERSVHGVILTIDDVEYLRGLEDAGIDGAGELIEAIHNLRQVELDEEY